MREAAKALIDAVRNESLARMVTSEAYTRAVERVGRVRGRPLQLPLLKDRWNADYFQFGSIVLPVGTGSDGTIYFSGQAVKHIDAKTLVTKISPDANF
ncbi:MAG: hypothetical protein JRC77_06615 [Deltaproteobacteria bacterium]|nr:hypothetical protein [Deltaproteobacteria bacterium]